MDFIVITSINEPTKAVIEFAKLGQYEIVVVADRKTPVDWKTNFPNVHFLSLPQQKSMKSGLKSLLPFDHYSRKMLGYLFAISQGARTIIDTDDDNFPEENFLFPPMSGNFNTISNVTGWFNIYRYFTDEHIWPRGLPLRLINAEQTLKTSISAHEIGIWQSLANGDSDVDAIYRLISDRHISFENQDPVVLPEGAFTPFNSQSTLFSGKTFQLLYLPSTVTFRFTDILRSIVAQPILHSMNLNLGFTAPVFFQERNSHDYMKDFESEIPMYLSAEKALDTVIGSIDKNGSVDSNLLRAYKALAEQKIVDTTEIDRLEAWLVDLKA